MMPLNLLDRLGDWNPQLFRELKGRLQWRTTIVTALLSLLGQCLAFGYSFLDRSNDIPNLQPSSSNQYPEYRPYCTGAPATETYHSTEMFRCISLDNISFDINWQKWWQMVYHDAALWLLTGVGFLLLVGTVFMLLSDLAREERRGTLNFLRLSPQSAVSLLFGKLLGVPVLLYLAVVLAMPFHIWSTLASGLPLPQVLGVDVAIVGSWLFFSSLALLFALLSKQLSGFQAWVGSGALLMFLFMTVNFSSSSTPIDNPTIWFRLLSPVELGDFLLEGGVESHLSDLQWFYLPIGRSAGSLVGFCLLNYGIWIWGAWQVLRRRFHNPTQTFLSKQQSYWLVFGFDLMLLGFALQPHPSKVENDFSEPQYFVNFGIAALFMGLLILVLIALLTPERQTLQDWTRYRHLTRSQGDRSQPVSLIQDLIWGEKSPALGAIAINLAISSLLCLPWLLPDMQYSASLVKTLFAIAFAITLLLICASLAQLMLMMKTQKRAIWAFGTVATVVILPIAILAMLGLNPATHPVWFLLSALPWVSIPHASFAMLFQTWFVQGLTVVLLTLRLTHSLRRMGESGSKALLHRPTMPTLKGTPS